MMFERLKEGRHGNWFPVLLEIDRATMSRERIKRHIRSRIEFVERGEYARIFKTQAVVIAYATTGAGRGVVRGEKEGALQLDDGSAQGCGTGRLGERVPLLQSVIWGYLRESSF
jgi:hypothetical protein